MITSRIFFFISIISLSNCLCPKNTFTCKDGSCIPQEWINDGESDCDDGSDEQQNSTHSFENILEQKKLADETVEEDPFDQIVTIRPNFDSVKKVEISCQVDTQEKINQCSSKLIAWLRIMNEFDLTTMSLLKNREGWENLHQACNLVAEYRTCIGGLVITGCTVAEAVNLWSIIELYTCQLIVPSVKEHQKCFAIARDTRCSFSIDGFRPTICRIISSISSDLDCVQHFSNGVCDENALEVLSPMQSETSHVYSQLKCDSYSPSSSHILPKVTNPCPECFNVLQVLLNIELFCHKSSLGIWTSVQRIVCVNKEKLMPYTKCYVAAFKQSKCEEKFPNGICAALEQFISNIDCAIITLNDMCEIDAQNAVVALQNALSDEATAQKCYQEKKDIVPAQNNDGFALNPSYTKCSAEQENGALVCLVELVELNKRIGELQTFNFLLEISDINSSLINHVCQLYNKYSKCINDSVFSLSNGVRCSFNSPLNTLARIGLSPICEFDSRNVLQKNRECILKVQNKTSQCQSALSDLSRHVTLMLQGIHGEAILCKTFYNIRNTFECGEKLVIQYCSHESAQDLIYLRQQLEIVGTMEGCPSEIPDDLDEVIAKPVVPVAHPLPSKSPQVNVLSHGCDPTEQKRFSDCVQPLTSFQPHPLSVIRQPKQIDNACQEFKKFNECRADIKCIPLWAKGMTAMFQYACGSGYSLYNEVKQCIRKMTTRDDVRECVGIFSKSAPQVACQSSNNLFFCTAPAIKDKCGVKSEQFIKEYIEMFATAIDPDCIIGTSGTITGHNCTASENQLIQHCAAPLNELSSRIDELFEGGLKAFLSNVKNLAPVFAQGCNLTAEFHECLHPLKSLPTQCVVSSCLIRAGDGICEQNDTAKAIDDNLGCIFQQASDTQFGKCLRTTIATLKTFNLDALRTVLPQFVNCIENIVIAKCGPTPLNVLRAISSTDICPIDVTLPSATITSPRDICNTEMLSKHLACVGDFYLKYRYLPVAILNDASDIDKLCSRAEIIATCSIDVCGNLEARAFHAVTDLICARKAIFNKHSTCLATIATSEKGSNCLAKPLSILGDRCRALLAVASCSAPLVSEACGHEALTLSFDAMNSYIKQVNESCEILIPSVSLNTGCSEFDLLEYLQCEANIDRFSIRPISIISNASLWDEFCLSSKVYEKCLANMTCKLEPVTSANTAFFRSLCDELQQNAKEHLACLVDYTNNYEGQKCIGPFMSIDFFAKTAPEILCTSLQRITKCASQGVRTQCGDSALLFIYKVHSLWSNNFNSSCMFDSAEQWKEGQIKPVEDFSLDFTPVIEYSVPTAETSPKYSISSFGLNAEPEPTPLIINSEFEPKSSSISPTPTSELELNARSTHDSIDHFSTDLSPVPKPELEPGPEPEPEPEPQPNAKSDESDEYYRGRDANSSTKWFSSYGNILVGFSCYLLIRF